MMTTDAAARLEADFAIELASLLSTRLCHDLSGAIGAVSAGVELLAEDPDPAFLAEAVAMLRHSAAASSARLKFLRGAFGIGGGDPAAGGLRSMVIGFADAQSGGIRVDWRERADEAAWSIAPGAGRLLLNLCLAGFDCLGGGGGLIVEVQSDGAGGGGGLRFAVTAEGPRAAVADPLRAALEGHRDGLTPRTAQGYLLHTLARPGGGLIVDAMVGRVVLAGGVPGSVSGSVPGSVSGAVVNHP